jgi:Retrotransposon gag protein
MDSNKHAVKSVPGNANKLKSYLKAEIKSVERQLRSDHTTTHYSLGDQPNTPLALLEVADDISLKSPSTTALFEEVITAVGTTPIQSTLTPHAVNSPPYAQDNFSVLKPHLSLEAGLAPADNLDSPPPLPHAVQITTFYDELNETAKAAFSPMVFTGACEQESESWHSSLLNYIDFKVIPDDKKLSFFELRLADGAKNWLNALPENQKATFDNLTAAFFARLKPKDLDKYQFAKELLNLRQSTHQSGDQFITILRMRAARAAADEKNPSLLRHLVQAMFWNTTRNTRWCFDTMQWLN